MKENLTEKVGQPKKSRTGLKIALAGAIGLGATYGVGKYLEQKYVPDFSNGSDVDQVLESFIKIIAPAYDN